MPTEMEQELARAASAEHEDGLFDASMGESILVVDDDRSSPASSRSSSTRLGTTSGWRTAARTRSRSSTSAARSSSSPT